jgi:ABC-type multidrug transport system fused ATPase/permease subunit
MPRSVVALDRIDDVLAARPDHVPHHPVALPAGALAVTADALRYGHRDGPPVLDDCTLQIGGGEVVALVGPTGCGKTTLCELLAGLDRPDRGTVRVGGVDVSTVSRDELRANVALVFQESFLFADTIAQNISLGAGTDETAVRWAAGIAHVARFVDGLPEGYGTVIGERGVTLSGGQRQRIALARALVRRPRFLLLDDATSAVDATVESRILHGLRAELDMTTLIVAHRVSTIALADRVLFMQDGRIVAAGKHTELLATNPEYETMVRAYEQEVA